MSIIPSIGASFLSGGVLKTIGSIILIGLIIVVGVWLVNYLSKPSGFAPGETLKKSSLNPQINNRL